MFVIITVIITTKTGVSEMNRMIFAVCKQIKQLLFHLEETNSFKATEEWYP